MKVIVAGSRAVAHYALVANAIRESGFDISEIVSGGARGVDQLGELYALRNGIRLKRMPAEWNAYGKSAGFRRNAEMAEYADALVAIWDGESSGTGHMIQVAKRRGLRVFIREI